MESRIYRPPSARIVETNTVFEITGSSGFMIENIGSIDLNVGTESEEIIPITAGNARQFEAPEGGTYAGNYSLVFNGGSGRALLIFNTPQGSVDPSRENGGTQSDYKESLV